MTLDEKVKIYDSINANSNPFAKYFISVFIIQELAFTKPKTTELNQLNNRIHKEVTEIGETHSPEASILDSRSTEEPNANYYKEVLRTLDSKIKPYPDVTIKEELFFRRLLSPAMFLDSSDLDCLNIIKKAIAFWNGENLNLN